MKPLVSIITPTYNSQNYIKDCINSVINQSFDNWEYIIIDDNSTDSTVSVIQNFCKKNNKISYFSLNKNMGAAFARNEGIKRADGKYIAFLDSDDTWHKDKLKIQINTMEQYDLKFTFTNYFIVNKEKNTITEYEALKPTVNYNEIIRFNYIACSTVMYNQDFFAKQYMPNIRNRQDWGLWIKLINIAGKAHQINQYLTYYYIRRNSISSNKLKMIKYHWYIYYEYLNFALLKSVYYLMLNIIMHVKKKRK
jgi:glycosyltransferase involved in cell wall biosynthesis